MAQQDLKDENVPAQNMEGYDFILNTASIIAEIKPRKTWQLMVVRTPWDFFAETNNCFSKFLADDSLEWHFTELPM